jgi:hypothetical protein
MRLSAKHRVLLTRQDMTPFLGDKIWIGRYHAQKGLLWITGRIKDVVEFGKWCRGFLFAERGQDDHQVNERQENRHPCSMMNEEQDNKMS